MAENPLFQDRGSPAIFGALSFSETIGTAATAAGSDATHNGARATAIMPFNAYFWAAGIQLDTAVTAGDSFTVAVDKGATALASTVVGAGVRTLAWTFDPAENTIAAGDAITVRVAHAANGATYVASFDLWFGPRSNTL